jgi:alkanesulfonate monooxygenase SsuD/methylene tetrahydromethanopterin reductase-like flavin-dependent oxidoreductase (luciferase family)
MRFGLDFPPFGDLADPRRLAEVAAIGEEAGWDGVFIWDHLLYRAPVTDVGDPWIGLAAMATATERVRLGPMVSPVARRRPQIVARQATALDQLSSGRLILGVGLGLDRSGREFSAFGEELNDRTRGEMLTEAIEIIDGLWSGEPYRHEGDHYAVDDVAFLPRPMQRPRPPIWVAGRWPYRRPMGRAARWDGLFLIDQETPDQLAEAAAFVADERGGLDGFDLVIHQPPGSDPTPWEAVGVTWWLTSTPYDINADAVLAIARAGPPR